MISPSSLKQCLKKSPSLSCALRIFRNLQSHLRFFFGKISTDSGTTHTALSIQESLNYITSVFQDYKTYAGVSHFHGHVCELGPGDSSGVALKILADGAFRTDLADRFYSHRDSAYHEKIYRALADQNPAIATLLKDADLRDETRFPGVTRYYGPQAAGEVFFKERPFSYDFIISRSVLEHTTDPLITLEHMYHSLKPGGFLIHKVDLRDHGMFTPVHHDLKFLEIPKSIYWAMTHKSGLPNRILLDQYRALCHQLPGSCQLLITHLAYAGAVEPHLPFEEIPPPLLAKAQGGLDKHKKRFASPYKHMADSDLMVSGFFLTLQKPEDT